MKISLRRCEFLSEEYFVNLLNGRNWLAASRKRITGVYVGKSRGEGGGVWAWFHLLSSPFHGWGRCTQCRPWVVQTHSDCC